MFAAKPTIEVVIRVLLMTVILLNAPSPATASASASWDTQTTATTSNTSNDIASGLTSCDVDGIKASYDDSPYPQGQRPTQQHGVCTVIFTFYNDTGFAIV